MPPAPRIYGVPWVNWPTVGADLSRVAARFFAFLRALVVQLTKRLKLAEEEFLLITLMWLDVVSDRRSIDTPYAETVVEVKPTIDGEKVDARLHPRLPDRRFQQI